MKTASSKTRYSVWVLFSALLVNPLVVGAQSSDETAAAIEEIVVTARKRDETLQEAPVAVSVFTNEALDRFKITDVESLSDFTPGLYISPTLIQGPSITLRGVGTPSGNMSSENSVSYVYDNVPVSTAVPGQFGQFDMQQTEVLKGPQSLFFGKNSTAGLLNYVTNDPGDEFELIVKGGYEDVGEAKYGEVIISGPLSDTVRARLAVRHNDQEGWFDIEAAPNTLFDAPADIDLANGVFRPPFIGHAPGSQSDRGPKRKETFFRGTLLWDPTDRLSMRAKVSYSERNDDGVSPGTQYSECNGGSASPRLATFNLFNPADVSRIVFIETFDDCKVDDNAPLHAPSRAATDALLGPGSEAEAFGDSELMLATVEFNYEISDQLTLTSVTGLYDNSWHYFNQFGPGRGTGYHAADVPTETETFTQEIRLTSHNDGPFNWMAGAYWEDGEFENKTPVYFPVAGGLVTPLDPRRNVTTEVWSAFAQGSFDLSETVNLSVGGRYTEDQKEFKPSVDGVPAPAQPYWDNTFDNFSPEVTATWAPADHLNFYASYKEGFVSGGYQVTFVVQGSNLIDTPLDLSYAEEEAQGFEVGAKTTWVDGRLRLNAAVYTYDYTDLQAVVYNPELTALSIVNAGKMNTTGIEVDVTYLPASVEGLMLFASISNSNAEFDGDFLFECYAAQTAAQGCTETVPGVFQQNLKGQAPTRAPENQAFIGMIYETSLTGSTSFEIFANASYTDEFFWAQNHDPRSVQDSHWKTNAGVTFYIEDNWKLSLVGRNLGDKHACGSGGDMLFPTNSPPDQFCTVQRGRSLWGEVEFRL